MDYKDAMTQVCFTLVDMQKRGSLFVNEGFTVRFNARDLEDLQRQAGKLVDAVASCDMIFGVPVVTDDAIPMGKILIRHEVEITSE
jgi:hypothetical protein